MLCLFECISLERFRNLRIAFALCLTAHCQIHANLGALAVEVHYQAVIDFLVYALRNADLMLASKGSALFLLDELLSRRFALGAELRSLLTFIDITAYRTHKFFHDRFLHTN